MKKLGDKSIVASMFNSLDSAGELGLTFSRVIKQIVKRSLTPEQNILHLWNRVSHVGESEYEMNDR